MNFRRTKSRSPDASRSSADEYVDGILTFIEALDTFPERGTVRESVIPGLRIIGYKRSVSVAFSVRGWCARRVRLGGEIS